MRPVAVLLGALIATAAGGAFGAAPAGPEEGKSLLIGSDTAKMRVFFRKLDDGAILWTSPTSLGTHLSAAPGHHKLNVMCEFKSPGVTQMIAGDLAVDLEAGHVYDLTGTLDQGVRKCNVTITRRS